MALLVRKISEILTLDPAFQKASRHIREADLGLQKNWAMYIEAGQIAWIGPEQKIPKEFQKNKKIKEISAKGKTILPGFVECHTHSESFLRCTKRGSYLFS